MVGPFIFFDLAGPAELLTGQGIDVRPHPHIGLGTVTYLFRGDFHHRDSTGADQIIRPGALNWMVAGRGVSHSERTSAASRSGPNSLFGIQTWLALPESHEDMAPTFEHHGKEALPVIKDRGVRPGHFERGEGPRQRQVAGLCGGVRAGCRRGGG